MAFQVNCRFFPRFRSPLSSRRDNSLGRHQFRAQCGSIAAEIDAMPFLNRNTELTFEFRE
jgi:hypothetical protein